MLFSICLQNMKIITNLINLHIICEEYSFFRKGLKNVGRVPTVKT